MLLRIFAVPISTFVEWAETKSSFFVAYIRTSLPLSLLSAWNINLLYRNYVRYCMSLIVIHNICEVFFLPIIIIYRMRECFFYHLQQYDPYSTITRSRHGAISFFMYFDEITLGKCIIMFFSAITSLKDHLLLK